MADKPFSEPVATDLQLNNPEDTRRREESEREFGSANGEDFSEDASSADLNPSPKRLCWWRDPETYSYDGLPICKREDCEARYRYERAQAEVQFQTNLDGLTFVSRPGNEVLIWTNLENWTKVYMHDALCAFGDRLLDKQISGAEALIEFNLHADTLLNETLGSKWLCGLATLQLDEFNWDRDGDGHSATKQFMIVQGDTIDTTRREFEKLLWQAELLDASSPKSEDNSIEDVSVQIQASVPEAMCQFRNEGEIWVITFAGKTIHVRDILGLGYIAELLRRPRVEIEATQLAGTNVESSKLAAAPGIPMADERTIRCVRANLVEKKDELADLPENDWTQRGVLQEEISKLEKYLGEVETHQKQARKVAGTAERSRTSVTNAIKLAIVHISRQHPDLGRHLKDSIKTGTAPVYGPPEIQDWDF